MSIFDSCTAESAYLRLVGERLARSRLEARSVAYLEGGSPGQLSSGLVEAARSVTVLHESGESPDPTNRKVNHQRVMLPDLPYPDEYFEAVIAFGVLEGRGDPEALIREARRVLTGEGTLVLVTPDKQAYANERNLREPENRRTLYIPELRELLEGHFQEVRLYRAGAVAGGLVSELGKEAASVAVDAAGSQLGDHVLAFCGPDAEVEQPRLVLDERGLAFEEISEARRESELLRAEIRQMQHTEVQSFRDALKLERGRVSRAEADLESREHRINELQSRLEDRERILEENETLKARNGALRKRLHQIESSRTWRALGLYRRLRAAQRGSE